MRKILLPLLLLMFTYASGQNRDLSAKLITPLSNATLPPGLISVQFDIVNNGPDPINKGDTVYFAYLKDLVLYDFKGQMGKLHGFILNTPVTAGQSIPWSTLTQVAGVPLSIDLTTQTVPTNLCAYVAGVGKASLNLSVGDPKDPNKSNNGDCFKIAPSGPQIINGDFEATYNSLIPNSSNVTSTAGWGSNFYKIETSNTFAGKQSVVLETIKDPILMAAANMPPFNAGLKSDIIPGLLSQVVKGPVSDPDKRSLSFVVKSDIQPKDTAVILAQIKDTLLKGSGDDVILYEMLIYVDKTISAWTPNSFPLAKNSNVNTANYTANAVFLYATSSIARLFGRGTGLAGTKLWLDNVELILPPQTPGTVTGLAAQCASAISQTYSIAPVANATTYNWTVPSGWTITSGQGTTSIIVTAGTSGQNGNITVTAGNTSGTSSAQTFAVTVGSVPVTPGTISGTAAQTPSTSNQTFSISSVSGATSYTWTVPSGWTITSGQGSTTITVTTGTSGQNGNITVSASNACGASAVQTLAVSINTPNAPSIPGNVSGLAAQCASAISQTYSIAPVANATTYNWTVPSGWTITSGQGTTSIVVTAGTSGQNGNITVTAGNTSGTSSAQTFAVTVGSVPVTPGTISGTAAQTPSTSNQTFSISSVSGATTYTWTVPVGWTITSGQGSASINVTTGTSGQNGNVSVTAGNACGTSVAQTLAVSILNVGINEANTLKTVIVYPNPANEVLNIKIEEEIQSVVLASIDGKVVYQGNESSVNTSALRSGLYVYEVTSVTGKVAVGNFIKQ